MKKIVGTLLTLLITIGLNAFGEDTTGSDTTATPQSTTEIPTAITEKPKADKSRSNLRNNLFYGGYLNLSFGSYTVIGIEPMIGYKLTPKLSTGIKVRYDYIKDDRYNTSRTTSTYGGSVFARYRVTPKFYAQLEPATYNYEYFYFDGSSEREWVPFLFLGAGFVQPLGERSWMNIQILFDVLQDNQSPYDDWEPFFSIGVGTGF